MNPAIRHANQVPSIVQKLVSELGREKILPNNLYSKGQLPLCCLKIELYSKTRSWYIFRLYHFHDLVSSSTLGMMSHWCQPMSFSMGSRHSLPDTDVSMGKPSG